MCVSLYSPQLAKTDITGGNGDLVDKRESPEKTRFSVETTKSVHVPYTKALDIRVLKSDGADRPASHLGGVYSRQFETKKCRAKDAR
jgi:hypothetical protein